MVAKPSRVLWILGMALAAASCGGLLSDSSRKPRRRAEPFQFCPGLDRTFGRDGLQTFPGLGPQWAADETRAVVVDASGRLVAAGRSRWSDTGYDMTVRRLQPSGELDLTFGLGGFMIHDSAAGGGGDDEGRDLALDSSGRIVVVGSSRRAPTPTNQVDMAVWRLEVDGLLDVSFSGQGFVTWNNAAGGSSFDSASALAIDSTGRILAVGGTTTGTTGNLALWAILPSGDLDSSFGAGGFVTDNRATAGGQHSSGVAIQLDAEQRIVLAGGSEIDLRTYAVTLWRYQPQGVADVTFGDSGAVAIVSAPGGNPVASAHDLAIDRQGRILVAARERRDSRSQMALYRLDAGGVLDSTFGNAGMLGEDVGPLHPLGAMGEMVAVDGSGRIVVAGSNMRGGCVVWRYGNDGAPDLDFGCEGVLLHPELRASEIAIDRSGRYLLAGSSWTYQTGTSAAFVRLIP